MTYEIIPCLPVHIREIRDRLRGDDRYAILCAGLTMKRAVWQSYKQSLMKGAVVIDDRVVAVGGCGGCPLGGVGYPWLLTSEEVLQMTKIGFVREAKRMLAQMLAMFPRLEDFAHPEQTKTHKFLELLGFKADEDVLLVGPKKVPFKRFWMER